MTTRFAWAALCAAALSACSKNEGTDPSGASAGSVAIGETKDVGTVGVTLIRVENDSRCASDVTCVWAGDATAVITVRTPGGPAATLAQQFVHTTVDPRYVDVSGYRVHLDSLKPTPVSTHPIDQKDYVAYVTVTKLGQ